MGTRHRHITLVQVAKAAGVSLATVSYSLRKDPRIPRVTAARVQAAARRLGYRPNPRVSALMAHIRQGRPVAVGERIAFLWLDAQPGKRPYRKIFKGAQERAEQLGYTLEEFWTLSPGMSNRRLQRIISTRGITGLLISPSSLEEPKFKLDWDWTAFAPAIIGTAESVPELHHSAHHHYGGMQMAMRRLQAVGRRRIVGLLSKGLVERARRTWSAAFVTHHPLGRQAWDFLRQETPESMKDLLPWLRQCEPDAIVIAADILTILLKQGWRPSRGTSVVLLHWHPNRWGFGGIDQCEDIIAANAVDLVAGQLQNNERGVPEHVKMLLCTGKWVPGKNPARKK